MEQSKLLKHRILVIGEGITEFYYFQSLKDRFPGIQISSSHPNHPNIHDISQEIEKGVKVGYDHIFCAIDMDNKEGREGERERHEYEELKRAYSQPIETSDEGMTCNVKFFETHRCIELFFLYYFRYTSKAFLSQDALIKELRKYCKYEKSWKFFRQHGGLHSYFEKRGGSLENAIKHAKQSMKDKEQTGRTQTYSELGELMDLLMEYTKN